MYEPKNQLLCVDFNKIVSKCHFKVKKILQQPAFIVLSELGQRKPEEFFTKKKMNPSEFIYCCLFSLGKNMNYFGSVLAISPN